MIPNFLIDLERWVGWRTEIRNGKPTKVPKTSRNTNATSTAPGTWAPFAAIAQVIKRQPKLFDGVGIVLGELGVENLCGIDLDSCIHDGVLADWAEPFVAELPTYTEVSPSGGGLKLFFRCSADDARVVRSAFAFADGAWGCKRSVGTNGADHGPAVEVYIGPGRYFTVTGRQWPSSSDDVALIDRAALLRLAEIMPKPRSNSTGTDGGRDSSRSAIAFRKGAALRRQGKTFDEFCEALRADPETTEWCSEKGDLNGGRELHRIWDKAGQTAEEVDRLIAEFNAKYMVVNEAGKALIYAPTYDLILRRSFYNRMKVADLRLLYQNRLIEVGVNAKGIVFAPAAEVWLRHENRRQFIGGVIFDPSGAPTPPDTLNLWQGFAVAPKPGTWEKLRLHVRDVICGGNTAHYNYLIRWLARMVQFPAEQGEVAIVMRGDEGTGKGTLARAMMRILGQHALHIANAKHLVGNFNAHLRDCVFLFADESFYAGDKAHVGVLKSLITEPYLTIEAKFANAVQTANVLHIMMASNEDWVVPASLEARRFCVLVVSDAHKDDHAYFADIWREMDAGGYAAMLHDLLHVDLVNFNVRRVPLTEGLQEQKKLSLDTTNAWWFDVLYRGYVFRSKLGLEDYFSQWHEDVATELLYASYIDFAEKRRERHPIGREAFGRFLATLGHKPCRPRNLASGEHITNVELADGGNVRMAQPICLPRPHGYHLGT